MQPGSRHLQTLLAPAWGNSRRDCFYRVQAQAGEAERSRVEKAGNQLGVDHMARVWTPHTRKYTRDHNNKV